jgi:hypothetical protein
LRMDASAHLIKVAFGLSGPPVNRLKKGKSARIQRCRI